MGYDEFKAACTQVGLEYCEVQFGDKISFEFEAPKIA
jgi:hypothetical protein